MAISLAATKLAVIGGTGLANSHLFDQYEREHVETSWGVAEVFHGPCLFLQRHGPHRTIPPHKINHRANLEAMRQLEVTHIVGVNSVGSLNPDLAPGTLVVPDDFFSPFQVTTFHDEKCVHTVPEIDAGLRQMLVKLADELDIPHSDGGVYSHFTGPRFETKAESRWLSTIADVAGMTTGGEIPLANELQIPYAFACMVDNYANGITKSLSIPEMEGHLARNLKYLESFINKLITTFKRT